MNSLSPLPDSSDSRDASSQGSNDRDVIVRVVEREADNLELSIDRLAVSLDLVLDHLGIETRSYEIVARSPERVTLTAKASTTTAEGQNTSPAGQVDKTRFVQAFHLALELDQLRADIGTTLAASPEAMPVLERLAALVVAARDLRDALHDDQLEPGDADAVRRTSGTPLS